VDTLIGIDHKHAILTIVERKSYLTLLAKIESNRADIVRKSIINTLAPFMDYLNTITSDNGIELSQHKNISEKLGAEFYFTHHYSAWEKVLVENVNGLIRQYVPQKAEFSQISPEYIRMIEDRLNNRPRKSLGWKSPLQVFLSNFIKSNQNVAPVT
jgi:IS30 family transposase